MTVLRQALLIGGAVFLAGGLVFFLLWRNAELRNDNQALAERLGVALAANNAQNATIARLRSDADARDILLAQRDMRIDAINTAAVHAVIAIQGAGNDNPQCNVDAPLPVSLSGPLFLLHSQLSGRGGAAGDSAGSAPRPVPGQAGTGTAARVDGARSGAVDGRPAKVGR